MDATISLATFGYRHAVGQAQSGCDKAPVGHLKGVK
jgi:hypothetical protein